MNKALHSEIQTFALHQLKKGQSGVILDIHQSASNPASFDIQRRLKELGFIGGEAVTVLHKAFFGGDPLAVRVGNSTFALRRFEAEMIKVSPVSPEQS